jgi:hypothetical protein
VFRRHLIVHHGRDYERQQSGFDEIVVLSQSALDRRLKSVWKSQRHPRPSAAGVLPEVHLAQYLPPSPPVVHLEPQEHQPLNPLPSAMLSTIMVITSPLSSVGVVKGNVSSMYEPPPVDYCESYVASMSNLNSEFSVVTHNASAGSGC